MELDSDKISWIYIGNVYVPKELYIINSFYSYLNAKHLVLGKLLDTNNELCFIMVE